MTDAAPESLAERLNRECHCTGLDAQALRAAIGRGLDDDGAWDAIAARMPHAFAPVPVFLPQSATTRIEAVVRALTDVTALPGWRDVALAGAPAVAAHVSPCAHGVFFGYDFHVHGSELGLIEINTNAGGAMLNIALSRAQRACCESLARWFASPAAADRFESAIVDMFRTEWRHAGRSTPLRTIAIVDASPREQFLHPEFELFRHLFERHGIRATVTGPEALSVVDGELRCDGQTIDLVYNRLTDFMLEEPASHALREAWMDDRAVVTPHPQAHALQADKRLLAALSDADFLTAIGASAGQRALLAAAVPHTEIVGIANADRLWTGRRGLFFKPFAGYGGRAAYRGDKLTRRVWDEIVAGGYVAQQMVMPGTRATVSGAPPLKFDVRAYAYDGEVQWLAARLYQGQTTNFRTEGGGFAPVYTVPDLAALQ